MNVVIVDDELLARLGVRSTLGLTDLDAQVIAEARSVTEAKHVLMTVGPALVLIDIELPDGSGLDVVEWAGTRALPLEFIVLTSHQDFALAQRALDLKVSTYLVKYDLSIERLRRALKKYQPAVRPGAPGPHEPPPAASADDRNGNGRSSGLVVVVDRLREVVRQRENPELGLVDTAVPMVLHQVTQGLHPGNGNIRVSLDSHHGNRWFFRLRLDSSGGVPAPEVLLQIARNVSSRLRSTTNLDARVCIVREVGEDVPLDVDDGGALLRTDDVVVEATIRREPAQALPEGFHRAVARLVSGNREAGAAELQRFLAGNSYSSFAVVDAIAAWARRTVSRYASSRENVERVEDVATASSLLSAVRAVHSVTTESDSQVGTTVSDQIGRVVAYLRDHLGEKIRLEQLASIAHLSPSYLSTRFHREMNMTPTEFLQTARVDRADELIRTTSLSFEEIAALVGFPSAQYLARIFRRLRGVAPSTRRRNANEKSDTSTRS